MHKPCAIALSISLTVPSAASAADISDLMSMSLEDLAMLDVSMETASKFSQKLSEIPSAVYVLDGERIKRSGVRSIAEALMLVPGLNVTKFSETEIFVSARGFHDGLYNKMLVMMDGRSLFSPVYGGVYWPDIDYVLQDIDRIEVLRGPGGSIWGGNAVNGVINIITKKSADTQGNYVSATYADGGDYSASARHGFTLENGIQGRISVKAKETQSYPDADSYYIRESQSVGMVLEQILADSSWSFRAGAEQDGFKKPFTYYQFTNGSYTGYEQTIENVESYSAYVQFELETSSDVFKEHYSIWAQTNFDEALDAPGRYTTYDFDASYAWDFADSHTLLFGGGYRLVDIDFTHTYENIDLNYFPDYIRIATTPREVDSILNGFVQLETNWNHDLSTVVGLKAEYFEHTYSLVYSPQVRANYRLNEEHSVWAGIARSHVSPSYMNTNTDYYSVYYWDGSHYINASYAMDLDLENVLSHEFGYRYSTEHFEFDVALFYNQHENVRGTEFIGYGQLIDVNVVTDNYEAISYGAEIAAEIELAESWKVYPSYSYLTLDESLSEAAMGVVQENYYDIEQQHSFSIQSLWSLSPQWQFDLILKGQIIEYAPEYEPYSHVPNVLGLDARVAWQYSPQAPMLELVVQNIGEQEGYVRDWTQYSSGYEYEQLIYARLSHDF